MCDVGAENDNERGDTDRDQDWRIACDNARKEKIENKYETPDECEKPAYALDAPE